TTLRDHVLQAARERSSLRFVAVEDGGSTAIAPADEETPATGGVDAVLEVRVSRIQLTRQGSVNPPMTLLMAGPLRISRLADATGLYAETVEYRGHDGRKFVEWDPDE